MTKFLSGWLLQPFYKTLFKKINERHFTMIEEILLFDKWHAPNAEEVVSRWLDSSKMKKSFSSVIWRKFKEELSPVDAYKYLKARFGAPNGITMKGKHESLDNLIHWHYTIFCESYQIEFYGHSSGMEIILSNSEKDVKTLEREKFIKAFKGDFKKYGKAIGDVQRNLEKWTLFINPYVRLSQTINELMGDLQKLTLKEPLAPPVPSPRSAYEEYTEQLEIWAKNITKAAAIGTTIRMLLPVQAESFINLVLYICRKQEYIEDERMYDSLIRNQIDIRVKGLHVNCDGFAKPVNGKDSRFTAFHTMMNKRNDFLHGNINPSGQKIETVYIDDVYTPLFEDDESIFKKMMTKYPVGVSEREVQQDLQAVAGLIELVLECLDAPARGKIDALLNERFPGINDKSKEIASLIPNKYAESLFIIEPKATDNPDYQLFLEETGSFVLYIPADWKCEKEGQRYRFRPVRGDSEQLLLSIMSGEGVKEKKSNSSKKKKIGHHEFYVMHQMATDNAFHASYSLIEHNKIVLFTYTQDATDESGRVNGKTSVESIIGSFGFVAEESRVAALRQNRYNNFIKGIAASQQLIHNSISTGAFFESAILLLTQIDAMIRIAIVFDRRLKGLDQELDTSLLYHEQAVPKKSYEDIVKEAAGSGILEKGLQEDILSALRQRSILDGFIITSTSLFDVEKYAYTLSVISEEVNEVVKRLEQQLTSAGLSTFTDPDTDQFYRYYIKSKIGETKRK
jgi:hypothetical protein